MFSIHSAKVLLVLGVATLSLTACGAHVAAPAIQRAAAAQVSDFGIKGIPPTSAFQTVSGTVTKILPDDNSGLPHQKFIISVNGSPMECDNDTQMGQKVANLAVGAALTIHGVEYHDPGKDGIHWTHHASRANDAGWIKAADGTVYQ